MTAEPDNINHNLFEWNLLEPLNTELYEAMMGNESEEIVKVISKIRGRLSEINRAHAKEK